MVKQMKQFIRTILPITIIVSVVIGINGLNVLQAVQLGCEPDCPMHQKVVELPNCCQEEPSSHPDMVPSGSGANHSEGSPCCDGKHCLDSSDEYHSFVMLTPSNFDEPAPSIVPLGAIEPPPPLPSPHTVPPDLIVQTTPLHILTCVYLI